MTSIALQSIVNGFSGYVAASSLHVARRTEITVRAGGEENVLPIKFAQITLAALAWGAVWSTLHLAAGRTWKSWALTTTGSLATNLLTISILGIAAIRRRLPTDSDNPRNRRVPEVPAIVRDFLPKVSVTQFVGRKITAAMSFIRQDLPEKLRPLTGRVSALSSKVESASCNYMKQAIKTPTSFQHKVIQITEDYCGPLAVTVTVACAAARFSMGHRVEAGTHLAVAGVCLLTRHHLVPAAVEGIVNKCLLSTKKAELLISLITGSLLTRILAAAQLAFQTFDGFRESTVFHFEKAVAQVSGWERSFPFVGDLQPSSSKKTSLPMAVSTVRALLESEDGISSDQLFVNTDHVSHSLAGKLLDTKNAKVSELIELWDSCDWASDDLYPVLARKVKRDEKYKEALRRAPLENPTSENEKARIIAFARWSLVELAGNVERGSVPGSQNNLSAIQAKLKAVVAYLKTEGLQLQDKENILMRCAVEMGTKCNLELQPTSDELYDEVIYSSEQSNSSPNVLYHQVCRRLLKVRQDWWSALYAESRKGARAVGAEFLGFDTRDRHTENEIKQKFAIGLGIDLESGRDDCLLKGQGKVTTLCIPLLDTYVREAMWGNYRTTYSPPQSWKERFSLWGVRQFQNKIVPKLPSALVGLVPGLILGKAKLARWTALGDSIKPEQLGKYDAERITECIQRALLEGEMKPVAFMDYLRNEAQRLLVDNAELLGKFNEGLAEAFSYDDRDRCQLTRKYAQFVVLMMGILEHSSQPEED